MEEYSALSKTERYRWDMRALNAGITYKNEMDTFDDDAHPPYKSTRKKDPNAPRRKCNNIVVVFVFCFFVFFL